MSWTDADLSHLSHLDATEASARHWKHATVAQLRHDGCPWSLIGEALGVTRQAAQKRYGTQPTPDVAPEDPDQLELGQ